MSEKTVYVKVKTLEEALGSSLVPEGEMLRNTHTGAAFEMGAIKRNGGQVVAAKMTGNEEYPVTINGVIYSRDLLHTAKAEVEMDDKQVVRVFEDGTMHGLGLTLDPSESRKLLKVLGQGLSDEK